MPSLGAFVITSDSQICIIWSWVVTLKPQSSLLSFQRWRFGKLSWESKLCPILKRISDPILELLLLLLLSTMIESNVIRILARWWSIFRMLCMLITDSRLEHFYLIFYYCSVLFYRRSSFTYLALSSYLLIDISFVNSIFDRHGKRVVHIPLGHEYRTL